MSVLELQYTVRSRLPDRSLDFAPGHPDLTLGDFTCGINDNTLSARPGSTFQTVTEAREAFEPYLRDLECEWDLRGFPIEFAFSLAHSEASDDPSSHHLELHESIMLSDSLFIRATVTLEPPSGAYRATPIVDYLRDRWLSAAKRYTELPTSAAYALLTFLESHYGSRRAAAQQLLVDLQVLNTAGRLSSLADPLQGRKLKGPAASLTPVELGWLNQFVELVGKRMATVESGNPPTTSFGMAGLPGLEAPAGSDNGSAS